MQEQLDHSQIYRQLFIQDILTRLNSRFYMLQRFDELKTPLLSSLADLNYNCNITYEDWLIIKKLCDKLKRFEESIKKMSR